MAFCLRQVTSELFGLAWMVGFNGRGVHSFTRLNNLSPKQHDAWSHKQQGLRFMVTYKLFYFYFHIINYYYFDFVLLSFN